MSHWSVHRRSCLRKGAPMFSARRKLADNRLYTADFLEKLGNDLREAGFDRICVKLPHNLVGMDNHEISLEEFIKRQRNYPSIILYSESTDRREILKILF